MISGLQKMTLLDYPGKVACTVFLQGCNFRCPFCHNSSLLGKPQAPSLSQEELLAFLRKRQGILDGVCITGGEPTLCKELPELLKSIKDLGFDIKLDTNGYRPDVLKSLVSQGLVDYVAMDIKNCPDRYGETAGISNLDLAKIQESMVFLMNGDLDFEFRTTVVSPLHSVEDVEALACRIKGTKKYFLQNFVDSGDLLGEGLSAHEKETLEEMLKAAQKYIPEAELRGV